MHHRGGGEADIAVVGCKTSVKCIVVASWRPASWDAITTFDSCWIHSNFCWSNTQKKKQLKRNNKVKMKMSEKNLCTLDCKKLTKRLKFPPEPRSHTPAGRPSLVHRATCTLKAYKGWHKCSHSVGRQLVLGTRKCQIWQWSLLAIIE